MNNRAIKFIKNFSYTLTSNLISLIISTLVVLIIPKLIGVEEYGYWQLYLFYSSYVGFLHFGWSDGIYLRYGGKNYKELDKKLFFSQFYMMIILQIIIAIAITFIPNIFIENENKIFIFQMVAINSFIMNSLSFLLLTLQGTNRIKEYAQITIISRILYVLLILIFLIIGIKQYRLMILSDLVGKLVSLIYAIYCCKDIVFNKLSAFYFTFRETIDNINVGIKLMFANIASMMIIGVVRVGIEHTWDVSTFGKVSLTLSISNLMMVFINAVGIIMFPILRRVDEKKLATIYVTMRDFLMPILLGVLLLYYPIKEFLLIWLPKYSDSLRYMALIFPISIYEGKMALLINTYLKTLRKEKIMLKINIISLVFSIIITLLTTIILKNINLAVVSIVVLLAFRATLAEIYLFNIMNISIFKDIFFEVIMTLIFIITGWFISSWGAIIIYGIGYLLYILNKKNDIKSMIKNIKLLTGV